MTARTVILRLLPALLMVTAGCSRERMEKVEVDVADQSSRVQELEAKVQALEDQLALVRRQQQAAVVPSVSSYQEAARVKTLEKGFKDSADMIIALGRQVTSLSSRVAMFEASSASATATAAATAPVASSAEIPLPPAEVIRTPISIRTTEDPRLADFQEPPVGDDLFPVHIAEVGLRKILVGTHKGTRYVETGEVYRDAFGKQTKKLRTETFDVEDYNYEAHFSASNLTRTAKTVSCSAGETTRVIAIAPASAVTGITVNAIIGSDLRVESAGFYRRIPLKFE
jgi:outer membrane murein-binding lipoprotein Lpp